MTLPQRPRFVYVIRIGGIRIVGVGIMRDIGDKFVAAVGDSGEHGVYHAVGQVAQIGRGQIGGQFRQGEALLAHRGEIDETGRHRISYFSMRYTTRCVSGMTCGVGRPACFARATISSARKRSSCGGPNSPIS